MAPKCNLIIDSCCDLPYGVVDREGIDLLQFPYIFGDQVYSDDLYRTTSVGEFYQRMRKGEQPSTSQMPAQRLREAFLKVAQEGIPAVYICFASALSGSYDLAEIVLSQVKKEHPEIEVHIIDSKLASAAEGLVVYEAIRQREKGLTATELAKWVSEAIYFINCEFMVDDLEALRRGGRIPASVAYAGAKLDVKPLLSIDLDGKLILTGVARGRKKGLKQLADFYEKNSISTGLGQCVVVAHSDSAKDAEKLKETLHSIDSSIVFLDAYIGPVIGSHVGPDMVAIIFWGSDRREGLSVADRITRKIKGDH